MAGLVDGAFDVAQAILRLAFDPLERALRLELPVAGRLTDRFVDGALRGVDHPRDVLVRDQTVLLAPRDETVRATKMTTMAPNTATTRLVRLRPVMSARPSTVPAMKPPTTAPTIPEDDHHDQALAGAHDEVGDEPGDGAEDDPGDDAHASFLPRRAPFRTGRANDYDPRRTTLRPMLYALGNLGSAMSLRFVMSRKVSRAAR